MTTSTFGPGTLTIGETGTEIDVSCLVNGMRITSTKDEGDSTTKLCGTIKPGKIEYSYSLSGNIDVDSGDPDGLFALSQAAPGTQVPFTFTPNTADETSAAGTLVIDPLDFGADEYGDDLTSDLEFSLIGPPVYTYPVIPLAAGTGFRQIVVNGKGARPTTAATPAPATGKGKKSETAAA
jgi:hypothetical protein